MKLVVVPDSDRVEQWLIDSASTGRGDFIDLRQVCTLGQLVDRCEPARWSGLAPAEPLLVRLVLASHAPLAERAFGPVARTPDFAGHVHEVLSHLRAQNVTPRALMLAAEGVDERLAARAQALAAMWNALDATLKNRGLVDRAELVRVAARRLRAEGLPSRLRGFHEVEVRHVHDLFPARLELLEAFATACHEAGVGLQLWWPSTGRQQADLFVLDAVRAIEARWQTLSAEAFADLSDAPLSWVVPSAFADSPTPRPAPELTAFSAPTPRDEARHIASRVKSLVSAGVPPERIAVAFRDLADDTEALVEALADLDVPARARLGVPLPASAPGRLALSLFDLVEDAFPADELAALLESRIVSVLPAEAAAPRRAFLEAGLRDDLVGATASAGAYEVRLESLERRAESREPIAILRATVRDVLRLLRQIPDEARALELLEAWWDALTRLGVFASLSSRPDPLPARAPLLTRELDRALARDQAAGDALLGLLASLKQSLHASGLGERRMKRRDFARHVRRAAQDLNLNARGPRTGAVWLLDARELAGRSFDVVFLGGLVDGRMPGRTPPLPLLTEDDRAALNASGKASLFRLSVADSGLRLSVKLAEDRLLLHLALCAGRRVVVSRSRLDAAGRELLASAFRDALARAVEGFREVAVARIAAPPLDLVQSEGELRTRAALELVCPPGTRQTAQDPRLPGLTELLGAEAWLVEARHTSAMEVERLRFFGDPTRESGRFSGHLEPSVMGPLLEQLRFGAERPVSAAQFNVWARCAFQGLSRYLLGLDALEPAGEEADARVRGTFWHAVLRTLVPVLDRQGLLGRNDAPLTQVHAAIDEAVATAAAEAEAQSPVGHPALWELTRLRTATVMRRLVASDVIAPFPHARVLEVEAEFGTSRATVPALREVKVPAVRPGERDVYLRGQIDRVDQGEGVAGIIDYKTSLPGRGEAQGAVLTSDFQLPFYLLAVATWFPEAQLQALWLDLRRREVRKAEEVVTGQTLRSLVATDAATRDKLELEGRPNLANRVHQVLGALREGDFGARPVDCTFCKMRPVCRISSKRMGGG